jgi:hypothetical protein
MIGKVLFTLAVILVVALIWRTKQGTRSAQALPPRVINPPQGGRSPIRYLAYAVVVLLLLASGYLLYDHWRDSSEVIFIRVVDARSGRAAEYRAERGDIQDREFVTTDGRRIVLAETERLETSTVRSAGAADQN